MATPPAVPARDGSGNGANTIRVLYRDAQGGPSAELPPVNSIGNLPYPDVRLGLFGFDQSFVAQFSTNGSHWITVGEFTFSAPFPDKQFVGIATTSHNNSPGFTTRAHYSGYTKPHADIFQGPQLVVERSATGLVLSWPDMAGYSFFLVRSPVLNPNGYWNQVTNAIAFDNDRAFVTISPKEQAQFYVLRRLFY